MIEFSRVKPEAENEERRRHRGRYCRVTVSRGGVCQAAFAPATHQRQSALMTFVGGWTWVVADGNTRFRARFYNHVFALARARGFGHLEGDVASEVHS